ncbi:hypothetical protein HNQ51_000725 [Inhella inkyongensis]|uniref:DUF3025 domain-containing protein n=1 Tax=Inhella inkyongensis TaxID=392593 RepID=A0A840S1N4_9BURK|nr:DUF3025 domain-containing protein [Inhella inkyongensis]MBB5203432.1 hypothetical protein [Inhella inkyongensis]
MPLPAGFISAPWCAPLRTAWARIAPEGPVAARLNAADCPVRQFVPQAALPEGEAYEAFIARTSQVPTRDNAHDLLNGLLWCAQPERKLRLNALQAAAIAVQGVAAQRGPLRDALTLFDENGAWWPDCPEPIRQAWLQRDWRTMFLTHRALWRTRQPQLFGHALLEQLALGPRKGLCAHVLLGDPLELSAEQWAAKPFMPLPVLGVPGWWPANEAPAFYDDAAVFRPLRRGADA